MKCYTHTVQERIRRLLDANTRTSFDVIALIKLENNKLKMLIVDFINANENLRRSVLEHVKGTKRVILLSTVVWLEKEKRATLKRVLAKQEVSEELKWIASEIKKADSIDFKNIQKVLDLDESAIEFIKRWTELTEKDRELAQAIWQDIAEKLVDQRIMSDTLRLSEHDQILISYELQRYPMGVCKSK